MANKNFSLKPDQIRTLIAGRDGCLASDLITVGGHKVGYMYREKGAKGLDSGWRFFAGHESLEYMADPANHDPHDLNTIANYDPDIVDLLDAPIGSAFARVKGTGPLVELEDEDLDAD